MKTLLLILWSIESGSTLNPPDGDGGKAIGPYQIHRCYWKDSGVPGSYEDCRNEEYSEKVITAYMQRYYRKDLTALGRDDIITMARIHNGGPKGHKKRATEAYAQRAAKEYDRIHNKK